jgi:hypothetical protein
MDSRLLTASWTQKPRTRVQNRNYILSPAAARRGAMSGAGWARPTAGVPESESADLGVLLRLFPLTARKQQGPDCVRVCRLGGAAPVDPAN